MPNYDDAQYKYWIAQCYVEAAKSPDPSTGVGAGLVIGNILQVNTLSHNAPTDGWEMTEEDWGRPRKYSLVEHAERRAIYKAARGGLWTEGATLVGNWAACTDCARAIVEAGIVRLIRHVVEDEAATPGWEESLRLADEILIRNGVEIINVTGPIHGAPKVLRAGEYFDPSS